MRDDAVTFHACAVAGSLDLAVYIGRFRPFTNAHLANLREGIALAGRVLVIVGSAGGPRTPKNPFTVDEVVAMARASLTPAENARVRFTYVVDTIDDESWAFEVVEKIAAHAGLLQDPRVGIIGFEKDASSYYLRMFPQYDFVPLTEKHGGLSATDIRAAYFNPSRLFASELLRRYVPEGTLRFLREFARTEPFHALVDAVATNRAYRANYAKLDERGRPVPSYPPTFITVDSVVICADHVLMIRRAKNPGKGLWALPGGFLDPGERISAAWSRELAEETQLAVPVATLRACLRGTRTYDAPDRDDRGRVITFAHHVILPGGPPPGVFAASDAAEVSWKRVRDLRRSEIYADHLLIIDDMIEAFGKDH